MIAKPTPRPKIRHPLKAKLRPVNALVREEVFERDHYVCRWCLVAGGRLDPHHRIRRSQGGKDKASNLISVHRLCHSYIHEHPTEAKRRGFLA